MLVASNSQYQRNLLRWTRTILTWFEADAVIAVVDIRVLNDDIVAPEYVPAVRVLSLVLGSADR